MIGHLFVLIYVIRCEAEHKQVVDFTEIRPDEHMGALGHWDKLGLALDTRIGYVMKKIGSGRREVRWSVHHMADLVKIDQ